jgi:hypothetical protein
LTWSGRILDGVHVGEHCPMVALGIAADGQKHALGLWEGSTENATLCQSLLANSRAAGSHRPKRAPHSLWIKSAAKSCA